MGPVLVRPGPVALFAENPGAEVDPAVSAALRAAAGWLEDAGYRVEQAAPPHFEEIARLFFTLIRSEERSSTTGAIERLGDDELRRARASTMAYASELDYDGLHQGVRPPRRHPPRMAVVLRALSAAADAGVVTATGAVSIMTSRATRL